MPPKARAPLPLVGRRPGAIAAVLFLAAFPAMLAIPGGHHSLLAMASIFYRSGALVFGGGHVVLPLLRAGLVPTGWLTDNAFLSGYGAAQALPGPLFTVAAYLGAAAAPLHSGVATIALWSATALGAVFLPGMLVVIAGLSVWDGSNRHDAARGALAGINAAVVGVLGAAFCTPVWPAAMLGPSDLAIAACAFILLVRVRMPPIAIVALCLAAAVTQSVCGLV
jgi:chromate transporter